MAEQRVEKIAKRTVDAAKPQDATFRVWNSELKGFGLKVTKKGGEDLLRLVKGRAGTTGAAARIHD
jgi:hypothetical protein